MNKKAITIIVDDDMAVIDFLADLQDRSMIRFLEKTKNEKGNIPVCLLANAKEDNLILVLLAHAPFEFNNADNYLMLYAHPDITVLISYFCEYIGSIPYSNTDQRQSIQDVLGILSYQKEQMNLTKPHLSEMG